MKIAREQHSMLSDGVGRGGASTPVSCKDAGSAPHMVWHFTKFKELTSASHSHGTDGLWEEWILYTILPIPHVALSIFSIWRFLFSPSIHHMTLMLQAHPSVYLIGWIQDFFECIGSLNRSEDWACFRSVSEEGKMYKFILKSWS